MRGRTKSDHFMRTVDLKYQGIKISHLFFSIDWSKLSSYVLWLVNVNVLVLSISDFENWAVISYSKESRRNVFRCNICTKVLLLLHHLKTYLDIWSKICLLFFMFCAHMIIEHSHLERNMVHKRPFEGWP